MAAHRYWRIRTPLGNPYGGDGRWVKVAFKDSYGGTDRANGFLDASLLASAVRPDGFSQKQNAFDSNNATIWSTEGQSLPAGGHWLGVDFGGTPYDIVEIAVTNQSAYPDPYEIDVEYSDDASTWTLAWKATNISCSYPYPQQTLTFTNKTPVPFQRTTASYALVAQNYPSNAANSTGFYSLTAATSTANTVNNTTNYALVAAKTTQPIRTTTAYALVAILFGAEERQLRAWTFTQDDHDFYVLMAGAETYVYDKLSEQWCQWTSPDMGYWRAIDGCDWNGINVAIDPDNGTVYQIDPTNRLDYGTTPIKSVIYGGLTKRFRDMTPCYMAEVAISQAQPPPNIDATTLTLTLETSDTVYWTDHGSINGVPSGTTLTARWYGIGLMRSPGHLFKITDTGYARRIDGLNIEVAGTANG